MFTRIPRPDKADEHMDVIWVEKYRPRNLADVVGQDAIIERLQAYVRTKSLPHLLFAGPAGTGKTTSAIAIAREVYGDDWSQYFQELNASDERGIDVVRQKIKEFARTAPIGDFTFKILFLDEADALTPDAQAALRRTMEKYTHTCRFILSCNFSSKIIDPIQSRCAVFRFRPIKGEDIGKYLKKIAKAEKVSISKSGLEALLYVAQGDMRRAINALQVAASVNKKIDDEVLYQVTSTARPEDVKKLIETALKGQFMGAREVLDKLLINYGLSGEDVVKQIHKTIFSLGIPDKYKVHLIEKTGEIEFRIVEGSNARIQIESLIAQFVLVGDLIKSQKKLK
jgi:replication factor C small subunit